jgi:hypothetical protein
MPHHPVAVLFFTFFYATMAYGYFLSTKNVKKEQNYQDVITKTIAQHSIRNYVSYDYFKIIEYMKRIKLLNKLIYNYSKHLLKLNEADKINFTKIYCYEKILKQRMYNTRSILYKFINKNKIHVDDNLEKYIYFHKMKHMHIIKNLDDYEIDYEDNKFQKKIKHDDNINYAEQCTSLIIMISRLNNFKKNRNKIEKYFNEKIGNFDVNVKVFETIQKMCDRNKINTCDILYYNYIYDTISKNNNVYFCAVSEINKCNLILNSICLYLIGEKNNPQQYYFHNHIEYMSNMFELCRPLIEICYNKWNVFDGMSRDIDNYEYTIKKVLDIYIFINDKDNSDIIKLIKCVYIFRLIMNYRLELEK